MDITTLTALAKLGAAMALGFAAIGSALGTGTAGMAGIGAWKNAIYRGKQHPLFYWCLSGPHSHRLFMVFF